MFQETIIKAWKGLKSYRESNRFSSWLFSIAHNVALDHLRKRQREALYFSYENDNEYSNNLTPSNYLEAKEISESINKSINELPYKQKEVFLLRQHGEMTFREISELMEEPISTVLSHMRYAVNKLKRVLREENV